MKKIILFTLLLLITVSTAFAQCKPDKVTKDKMTKEELSFWGVEIVKRSLGNKLLMDMNTTFPSIISLVGKSGDKYFIKFNVIVIEKSGGRAQFNSPFQGSKSSEVVLGFKEGGEPVKLHFDDVYNNQEITIDKDYMYTVSLTAYLDKETILKYKEDLTTKTIDIVQVILDNGKKMEGNVRDKNGDKMKDKYICFYEFLQNGSK